MPDKNAFTPHDHSGCTSAVLDAAEEVARSRGVRLTPVRRKALEILLEEHRALGAYEVLERLSAEGFGTQPPVAYRALDFLVEHGLAHKVRRLNAFTACVHPGEDHAPAFFICTSCHKVAEAPEAAARAAMETLARTIGFSIDRTSLEAVGTCPSCVGA